jgi:probable HAF family extracellular repeat protein
MKKTLVLLRLISCTILVILIALCAHTQEVRYTVTDLGTLGGGFSGATAINDSGQVVGNSMNAGNQIRGFLWRDGMMTDLGTLGGNFSYAFDINNFGAIVGHAQDGGGKFRAFLWENNSMSDLGFLGGPDDIYQYIASANSINDYGLIVGASLNPDSLSRATIWQGGNPQDLLTLGGDYSSAHGINNNGQVVGTSSISSDESRAFLWVQGMIELGNLGGYSSRAHSINKKGEIVGYATNAVDSEVAVMWRNGGIIELGTLGGSSSHANSINDASQVVGLVSTSLGFRAFLWEDNIMKDLNSLIDSESGWILKTASGINNKGQIVGGGQFNGQNRAFLLNPISSVSDLTFAGGTIKAAPFENVYAELARDGVELEFRITDAAGSYQFTETDEEDGYELTLSDHNIWGIQRKWRDLSRDDVHRNVRIPATMMKQLDAITDTVSARHYNTSDVSSLFRPYEHWADTSFTDRAEVDTSLARLIITHDAFKSFYDNTMPVSKELATALSEAIGFVVSMVKSYRDAKAEMARGELPPSRVDSFLAKTEELAESSSINFLTNPIIALLPSSPPELKRAITDARAIIVAEMRGQRSGQSATFNTVKTIAVRLGTELGDDLLMVAFRGLTQDDLDKAVTLADGFAYAGDTHDAWQKVIVAVNDNGAASDDAASLSEATRSTATDLDKWAGLVDAGARAHWSSKILRVAQVAGYTLAIARTGWQFYDTAMNDLPHAVSLAFDPDVQPTEEPVQLPSAHIASVSDYRSLSDYSSDVAPAIDSYLQEVNALVAAAESGNKASLIDQLDQFTDAANTVKDALVRAHLPITAISREAYRQIEAFPEAHLALTDAVIGAVSEHMSLSTYALSFLAAENTADELAAQADTVRSVFQEVVPSYEAVSALVAEMNVPPFVAVVGHELSVDSVEPQVPFGIHATVRNGGGIAAEGVVVTLVPDENMDVNGSLSFELGALASGEESKLSWSVEMHETATAATYQILIELLNGEGLSFATGFEMANATSIEGGHSENADLPQNFALEQNYPNPFNPSTQIRFDISEQSHVTLKVYDILGREVTTLVNETKSPGRYEVSFEAATLPSGVYLYRIEAGDYRKVMRMMYVR